MTIELRLTIDLSLLHTVSDLLWDSSIIKFFHIAGTSNPADVLNKHCGHPQLWPHIRPLLFYSGETSEIQDLDKTVARANSGDRVTTKPEAVEVKKMKRTYKATNRDYFVQPDPNHSL